MMMDEIKDKVETTEVIFIFNDVQKHIWYNLLKK